MITLILITIITIALLLSAAINNDSFSEIFKDFVKDIKTPTSITLYMCMVLIGVLTDIVLLKVAI